MLQDFMTLRSFGGMIGPMGRIFKQRTYGLATRYTTKAEGRDLRKGKDALIDNKRFSMDDICTVVLGLYQFARRRLHEE
ncbi:hypothetical protein LTR95_005510 [Oleoguttula sp. CCFEE 5521]